MTDHHVWMGRTAWRLEAAVALIAVTLIGAACDGGNGEDRTRASLAFGLRVPRGAHLIMPILPCTVVPFDGGCDERTTSTAAVLQIDSEPHLVLNDLLAQGRRLGMRGGVVRCQRTHQRVQCDGDMYRVDAATQSPTAPEVLMALDYGVRDDYGIPEQRLGPAKTLMLQFASTHLYGGYCSDPRQPCSSRVADFHVADPGDPKATTREGIFQPQFLAKLRLVPNTPETHVLGELRLLPNTHVVGHVVTTSSARGDALWLIAVDGDTREAAARYEAMIAKHHFSSVYSGRRSRVEAGWRISEWSIGGPEDPSVLVDVLQHGKTEYLAIRVTPYA